MILLSHFCGIQNCPFSLHRPCIRPSLLTNHWIKPNPYKALQCTPLPFNYNLGRIPLILLPGGSSFIFLDLWGVIHYVILPVYMYSCWRKLNLLIIYCNCRQVTMATAITGWSNPSHAMLYTFHVLEDHLLPVQESSATCGQNPDISINDYWWIILDNLGHIAGRSEWSPARFARSW